MRYRDGRRSICVSSQSGCPLTCTFCATGQMQFGRNLTRVGDPRPGAALPAARAVDHLVFMGMGEPMMNLDEVLARRAAAAGPRHHAPPHDDLDGRLAARAARASSTRSRSRSGSRSRCTRPDAALRSRAHAGERPLPARARCWRSADRYFELAPAQGVRRVRDARRRQRLRRSRRRSSRALLDRRSSR